MTKEKIGHIVLSLPLAGALSILLTYAVAIPTLTNYPRINRVMARFVYTDEFICVCLTLIIWLFYLQWLLRRVSVIFCYWSASIYLLLLFIVLFTKAPRYHSIELNPLSLLQFSRKGIAEDILNFVFFIPLGVIYHLFAKRFWEFATIALGTILTIEILQYVFYLGVFDIRDILLNFLGCWVGYWLYTRLEGRFTNKKIPLSRE